MLNLSRQQTKKKTASSGYRRKNTTYTSRLELQSRKEDKKRKEKAKEKKKKAPSSLRFFSFKKIILWFITTFLVSAFMLSFAFGFYRLTNYVINHPYFEVKNISIEGITHLTYDDITQLSGLQEGNSSFRVHINDVQARILQNPWIENVHITRMLPDAFHLEITERVPQFSALYNNTLYYVDVHGQLIAPIEAHKFISLPVLELGISPEATLKILPDFLAELQINPELLPLPFNDIAWLRLSTAKGIEMFWEEKQLLIALDIEDWRLNLEHLRRTVEDIKKRNEFDKVLEIHAGNNQVWLLEK